MKPILFFYSLPVLVLSVIFSGFVFADHPNNIEQSFNGNNSQTEQRIQPQIDPQTDASCTYSWSAQTSGTTSQFFTVSAPSDLVGWAAGAAATVRKTIDGGVTWTDGNSNPGVISGDIYNIYAIDASTAFVTTSPGSSFIYRTVNGGVTWTQVFSQAGGFIDAIEMISPTVGFAIGDPVGGLWTILKTVDGGATWARMATEPAQVGSEAGWNNAFLIVGNNIWFGTSNTRVYHSTDLGLSWTGNATTGALNSYTLHFNNTSDGMAGGSPVATPLVKTNNGGTTYSATATYPGTTGNLNGLEGNGIDWWAIRSGANVYRSVDLGTTWTTHYTQASAVYQDIDFSTSSGCASGWAVGNSGVISRMSNTSTTSALTLTVNFQACSAISPITVQLRSATSPYSLIESKAGLGGLNTPQLFSFSNASDATPYYIVVKYINSIETWSKAGGESFTSGVLSYSFTSGLAQAYGSNQILSGGIPSNYQGDLNDDGAVSITDVLIIYNDASTFVTTPLSDLTCDGITDISDFIVANNNASAFVQIQRP